MNYSRDIQQIYDALQANHFKVCTDSRKVSPGCVFFALKGDKFDANLFAEQALKDGAALAVADDKNLAGKKGIVLVEDVLTTLQRVATLHRQELDTPVIALTGSNGKTTTKELIVRVLSKKYKVLGTSGNLNNHIGVPLTLLGLGDEHEIAVVEMGASHQGEIALLCSIAEPDYGYITNFGKAHLEGFGTPEGIVKGKSELYDFLRANDAVAFVNGDDPIQKEKTEGLRRYLFSTQGKADEHFEMNGEMPFVEGTINHKTPFKANLSGSYNFTNCIAAATIGLYFGIDEKDLAEAIESYIPQNNRSQWIEKGSDMVMMDAYNANPSSMHLSIENFIRFDTKGKGKIAVLGDMFELGEYSAKEHQAIATLAELAPELEEVILVGEHFCAVGISTDKVRCFKNFDEFAKDFSWKQNKAYLIKGSRGMALERIMDLEKK